jgi:hypothetical protein
VLEIKDISEYAPLRVTTAWLDIEVISEPQVQLTYRGYVPALVVTIQGKKIPRSLFIAAKSIAQPLEEMRQDNNGLFKGLKFKLRKSGPEQTAGYEFQ